MATQIISETPINVYELKDSLKKIRKRDGELNFRAQKTEDHISQVATFKGAEDLFDKITKLDINRLREVHIHKIIDMMPATIKDLKVILQGYTLSISNENMKKIIDTVNSIAKK